MKPHETLRAAQMTFDKAKIEQALFFGENLRTRRQSLVHRVASLTQCFPNGEQGDRLKSKALFFGSGLVEGKHRRIFATATVFENNDDGIRRAGLDFFIAVDIKKEDLGNREPLVLKTSSDEEVTAIKFMDEYLPLLDEYNPDDIPAKVYVENKDYVTQMQAIEESLEQLFDLHFS